MTTTIHLSHSIEINEKFYTKVIIMILLLSVVFLGGNWYRTTQSDQNNRTINSVTNLSPQVQKQIEEALNKFTGGFIEQGSSGDPAIQYFIQNPSMSAGFGMSTLKIVITDNSGQNGPSYSEISVTFPNSNPVKPLALNPKSSQSTYFIGTSLGTKRLEYTTILYKNLYNKIDLEYTIKNGVLKYNFYVYPGGNPSKIQMKWEGPVSLQNTAQGIQITITTLNHAKLMDNQPISLQSGKTIQTSYLIKNQNTYSFSVGNYKTNSLLIIDPTFLLYGSYFGGTNYGGGQSIAVDPSGNIYVTGITASTNFPTFNAIQSNYGSGVQDAFVLKISSTGTLMYSTYIGSTGFTQANAIAVDAYGHAYVTGSTDSSSFPMVNAYNSTYGGQGDVFVLELSETGSRLVYSTYVGGSYSDSAQAITVDIVGNVFVTGQTYSTNFPTTSAYQPLATGGGNYYDTFVFCLASGGSSMWYSTFVSGSHDDYGSAITIDSSDNAYVTGSTDSNNFPTTNGAYNTTWGGFTDVFVFELSYNGTKLLFSTLIGGSSFEEGHGIALDSSNNVYVTGYTESAQFPTTAGAYNKTFGGEDIFVFKLSSDGSTLLYSTFISSGYGYGGIVLDNSGNAYVIGYTTSRHFPITANAYDNQTPSYQKAVIFELSSTGSNLLYSTYLGGYGYDYGYGIARDSNGYIYATGTTGSKNFPITSNAYQNTYVSSGGETFVVKLAILSVASLTPSQPMVISSNSTQSLGLIWNAPSFMDSFLHYNIYRGSSAGNYSLIGTSIDSHYVDYGITPGVTYHYAVSPVYTSGTGYKSPDAIGILQNQTINNISTVTKSNSLPSFEIVSLIILLTAISVVILSKIRKKIFS